jgi:hypothetical protein
MEGDRTSSSSEGSESSASFYEVVVEDSDSPSKSPEHSKQ